MFNKRIFTELLLIPLRIFFRVKNNPSRNLKDANKIIIIWQNESYGKILSASSIFKSLKEKYPKSSITLITNKTNEEQLNKPIFYDAVGFSNSDLIISLSNIGTLFNVLSYKYDIAISPSVNDFNLLSYFLMRLAKSKCRIGISSIDKKNNIYKFLFDRRIEINWKDFPDIHISQLVLEQLKPFDITTKSLQPKLNTIQNVDEKKNLISRLKIPNNCKLIGINNLSKQTYNYWTNENLLKLIIKMNALRKFKNYCLYFPETSINNELENYLKAKKIKYFLFDKNNIDDFIILLEMSELFITVESILMHVAGAMEVPQISLFGVNNPFNLAPLGSEKYFLRKSDIINEIIPEDVVELINKVLFKKDKV